MRKDLIRKRAVETIELIPKGYLSDAMIRETIRCVLFNLIREEGLIAAPAFRNPRYPEGPVDIVGLDPQDYTIKQAFCSNGLVELADVKSLERVDSEEKTIVSFSRATNKVKQSTFFLKPGIEHIMLYE